MTYAEAKKKLEDAGHTGEPTPEALKLAGWDADESIREVKAVGASAQPITDENMRLASAALHEEMKANALPAHIASQVTTVLKGVLKAGIFGVMICMLLFASGCGKTEAAQRHTDEVEQLAIGYANVKEKREAAQIADYRRKARAEADELTAKAIEAEKKRTDAPPAQIADNCVAYMNIKADHYAKIEENCIQLQNDFNSDRKYVIQLTRKTSELKEYFKGQNETGDLVKQSSQALIDTLTAFKTKKPDK